ncbi:MAG: flagellar motor switch protein FliG [Oligoflexales bacterium]|nr:flagellar motor switch protein FliG [Oligoflexales bacterium]
MRKAVDKPDKAGAGKTAGVTVKWGEMSIKKLSQTEKAAMLLIYIGEELAAKILSQMDASEVKKVVGAMNQIKRVDTVLMGEVIKEFQQILATKSHEIRGGSDFTKNVIKKAFGNEKAAEIESAVQNMSGSRMSSLEAYDPESLARTIQNEHPSLIALVLAHLDPQKGAQTLRHLPENIRLDLVLRIAKLDTVSREMVEEVDDFLRKESHNMSIWNKRKIGGTSKVASILASMGKEHGLKVLKEVDKRAPEIAEEVRKAMFVFEDLIKVDGNGIRELLKNVQADKWKYALKSCSDELKNHIFSNMSERAAKIMREDIESMKPVKKSQVEEAQNEILKTAKLLEEEGKLIVYDGREEYV